MACKVTPKSWSWNLNPSDPSSFKGLAKKNCRYNGSWWLMVLSFLLVGIWSTLPRTMAHDGMSLPSSRTTIRTTATTMECSTWNALLARGGSGSGSTRRKGFSSWIPFWKFQPSASELYRQTLEDQVLLLDRQLRQSRDELILLRKQLGTGMGSSSSSSSSSSSGRSTRTQKATTSALKQQVATLQSQVNQLERMKLQLEQLLEEEQRKVGELERQLQEQQALTEEIKERYERQLEALQQQLEQTARDQMRVLEKMWEERLKQAVEAATVAALAEVETKLAQATERVRQEKEREIEMERRRSTEAVEREKMKMRKLVKALAIREKKLFARTQQQQQQQQQQQEKIAEKQTTNFSKISSSSQSTTPKKPPTTRGPI